MAIAGQVAATRVALALAIVSDRIKIVNIDKDCVVETEPGSALGGKFSDLAIAESQMEFFRAMLAKECPEVRTKIMNRDKFPLNAGMTIQPVVDAVEAFLLNSSKWNGRCMPPIPK